AHLAETLAKRTVLPVREASDKDALEPGHVYIAPAGYHLLVERGSLALSTDEPERFSRPSIDVLFESVADSYRDEAVGIVLTGPRTSWPSRRSWPRWPTTWCPPTRGRRCCGSSSRTSSLSSSSMCRCRSWTATRLQPGSRSARRRAMSPSSSSPP